MAKQVGKLNKAKNKLSDAENHLAEKIKELQSVEKELINATDQKKVKQKKKICNFLFSFLKNLPILKLLEDDAANCRYKISSASELINSLSGERERWSKQSISHGSSIQKY